MAKRAHITVTVKDENIERKLRQFKKKIERERIIKDAKARVYYEPDCIKRRRKKLRAIKIEFMRQSALGGITYKNSH